MIDWLKRLFERPKGGEVRPAPPSDNVIVRDDFR